MKLKRRNKIISLLQTLSIVSLVGLCAAAWFHEESSVTAHDNFPLQLSISTLKVSYLKKEPIELTFDLANQTTQPITWSGFVDFGSNTNLRIRMPNGELRIWKGERGLDYPMGGKETTLPGKRKIVTRLMGESVSPNVFTQPGSYEIQVEFSYWDISSGQSVSKIVLSNSTRFDIHNPIGRQRAALEYIENVVEPIRRNNRVTEEVESLRTFAANFADSVYWKYEAFGLAKRYLELGRNQDAEELLYELSDKEFCFSDDVERLLIRLAITLNRSTPRTKRPFVDSNPPNFRVKPGPPATPVTIPPIPRPVVVPQSAPSIQ